MISVSLHGEEGKFPDEVPPPFCGSERTAEPGVASDKGVIWFSKEDAAVVGVAICGEMTGVLAAGAPGGGGGAAATACAAPEGAVLAAGGVTTGRDTV